MTQDTAAPASENAGGDSSLIRVLLVDDQRIIGEVVRRMLADQADIAYHYCAEGNLALDRAREVRPHVILQDLVLPGTDGITLVQQYRAAEELRHTAVVVLSAAEDAATRARAHEAGASGFMIKPPLKAGLIECIRSLAGGTGRM